MQVGVSWVDAYVRDFKLPGRCAMHEYEMQAVTIFLLKYFLILSLAIQKFIANKTND
jgi:hypothetical protein